jgi:signal transduction histidine kinase
LSETGGQDASGSGLLARRLRLPVLRRLEGRTLRPPRRLGKPAFDLHGRGELLALTYALGGVAVAIAWLADPRDIGNRVGLGALLASVFVAAAVLYGLRNHLPRYTGDVAIVGSLVLIDLALFFTRLHVHPGLLSPFFVWVGFVSPLWFPRAKAIFYAGLAVVASGVVVATVPSAQAVAGWAITMATLVVAFYITSFLTDALVKRERLAVVGEMASVVGHDLRNPLSAVSNALFLLRYSLEDHVTDDQERYFQLAWREIDKAASIVEHLSAYVRPGEPVVAPVDVRALVAEVLEVAPPPPGVDVTVDVAAVTLLADRGQLAQVLTNLVSNAYDAMGERGALRVVATIDSDAVLIEVEDDGLGIERSMAERVFEPFYTTKYRGTGLGLAIVRRLVEGHGGSVGVDLEGRKGARFTVRLPHSELSALADSGQQGSGVLGSHSDVLSPAGNEGSPTTNAIDVTDIQPTSRP